MSVSAQTQKTQEHFVHFMNVQTTFPRLYLGVNIIFAYICFMIWYGMFYAPERNEPARLLLAGTSLLITIFILIYQYLYPKHPKFLLLPRRKFIIRLHIACGTMEILLAVIAYFSPEPTIPAILTAIFALAHAATAVYQTPTVFGAQIIMVPGYVLFIILHAFCALMLLFNPTSDYWLVNTFIVLQTYAWVRVIILISALSGLFEKSQYSVAILIAGSVTLPSVMGAGVNLLIIFYSVVVIAVYRYVFNPRDGFKRGILEHEYASLIHPDAYKLWKQSEQAQPTAQDRAEAQAVFAYLDKNQTGFLETDELQDVLFEWRAPQDFMQAFLADTGQQGRIDFETFYQQVWQLKQLHERLRAKADAVVIKPAQNDEEKARIIFQQLDLNENGFIDSFELHLMIDEWGLPQHELADYLKLYADANEQISFETFYRKMKAVWHFAYYNALHNKH